MPKSNLCLNIENPADQAYYEVDLFNNDEIKLSLAITKFTQFNKSQSNSIGDVQIVANSKSDKVFGKQSRGDFDYSNITHTEYNCILLVDNVPIQGVFTFNELIHKSKSRTVVYKGGITGSRYIWINEIADRPLCELDLGYFNFSTALVQRSWDRFGNLGTIADTAQGHIGISLDPANNSGNYADPDDGQPIYRDAPFDHGKWTWRHNRNTHEGGFVFTPIHYGSWSMQLDPFDLDYPNRGANGPPPFVNGDFAVRVQDLRPSIYVKWIIEQIFEQWTEFTLVSKFSNTELFEGLILPYVSGSDWLPDLSQYEIRVGLDGPELPFAPGANLLFTLDNELPSNGFFDPLNLWNSTTYVSDRIITTKFTIQFDVDETDPDYTNLFNNYQSLEVELLINGGTVQTVTIPVDGTRFSTDDDFVTNATPDNLSGFAYQTLDIGDVVTFEYTWIPVSGTPAGGQIDIVDFFLMNVVRRDIPSDGMQIDLAPLLPKDLTVKKLFDGLTHMFNMVMITDPINKLVTYEPDEVVYQKGRRLVDWSSILDCGVDIIQTYNSTSGSSEVRGYEIKYKDDGEDGYVEELNSVNGQSIYSYITSAYDGKEARDSVNTHENPTFAPTWFLRDWDVQPNRILPTSGHVPGPPIWPRLWEEFEEQTDPTLGVARELPLYTGRDPKYTWCPRILYYNGAQWYENDLRQSSVGFKYQATGVSGSYVTEYPFYPEAVMVNYCNPSHYSLAFNNDNILQYPEIRKVFLNEGVNEPNDIGLISGYWVSYLTAAKYGSEVKIVVRLTPREIQNINFMDIIYISHPTLGTGIYRLGEISEYSPSTGKALIQLIRIPLISTEPII